jgi:hypothetical protein
MATKPKSKPAKSTSAATTTPKPKYTIKGGEVISKPATSPAKGKSPDWYVEKRAAAKAAAASKAPVTPKATPAAPKASPTPPKPTYKLSGQGATKAPYSPSYKGPTRSATPAGKSVATKLGSSLGKLKGKAGLIGKVLGGLTALGTAGYAAYNAYDKKSTPSKASAKSDFNKGKDPIQQYSGVKPGSSTSNKPAASAPNSKTAPKANPPKTNPPTKTVGGSTKTGGGYKSSPNRVKKPVSFSSGIKSPNSFKNMDTKLKANISSPKSFADMPRSKSSESNSSTASTASTASKSSASPLSKRATMKGLRKEKRSERKITRMARRENRIVNKTAKLKAKR